MKALAAAIIGAIIFAPTANADQYTFVAEIDSQGIYYDDILEVVDLGKMTCRYMRNGDVPGALYNVVSNGYAQSEMAIIVPAAISEMCPDQMEVLDAWLETKQ